MSNMSSSEQDKRAASGLGDDNDGVPAPGFDDPELISPRDDETLPLERLEPWLREHLEGAEGPLSMAQFRGGRANLTYLLRFGERPLNVLRQESERVQIMLHDPNGCFTGRRASLSMAVKW